LPEILQLVKDRPAPDVVVIGHTDTTGSAASNYQLGLRRATTVRDLLVAAGFDSMLITVMSVGEAEPLIPTPDETREARNRRVEVAVRGPCAVSDTEHRDRRSPQLVLLCGAAPAGLAPILALYRPALLGGLPVAAHHPIR